MYVVDQHSVEVPIPRELIQEQQAAQGMNVAANLDISTVAMATANDVLHGAPCDVLAVRLQKKE